MLFWIGNTRPFYQSCESLCVICSKTVLFPVILHTSLLESRPIAMLYGLFVQILNLPLKLSKAFSQSSVGVPSLSKTITGRHDPFSLVNSRKAGDYFQIVRPYASRSFQTSHRCWGFNMHDAPFENLMERTNISANALVLFASRVAGIQS